MDGERPSRARLIVRPLVLFLAVSALVFGLAKLHLAQPGVPKIALGTRVALGDPYRGETIFGQTCAACHGIGGKGGVGPRLLGDHLALAQVKAQIDRGGGSMPPALVSGQKERDVLAFVATLIAAPG